MFDEQQRQHKCEDFIYIIRWVVQLVWFSLLFWMLQIAYNPKKFVL